MAGAGDWAGLTAIEVAPQHRRQGLAAAITAALAARAVSHGFANLYLQVGADNSAARTLYQRLGFTDHHGYHYRVARISLKGHFLCTRKSGLMSTTQIDLDQGLLARAARVLGTKTKKDTVNEALRRVVEQEARQRHVDELASGALPDLADPETMAGAWR